MRELLGFILFFLIIWVLSNPERAAERIGGAIGTFIHSVESTSKGN